jgi:site-specific DNA-cytosine methylase
MIRAVVLYEASGMIRDALIAAGHDAISVDLRPTQRPGPHWQSDVFEYLATDDFATRNLVIAHPPCTYLAGSGLHWNGRVAGRAEKTEQALADVRRLINAFEGKAWAIENPVGLIGTKIIPAFDTVQPYEFGDDASKRTCFYGNLPPLVRDPAKRKAGRMVIDSRNGKTVERWANQTDSGQNRLPPSANRWALRSETYPGLAAAIAEQWGSYKQQRNLFGIEA